jgi:hypothetical protein
MAVRHAGKASSMSPASPRLNGHLRKRQEQQASRRLGVAKILRETPSATNVELARVFDVDRDTIAEDRKYLMTLTKNEAVTETQLYRENQLARITEKWDEIESDDSMTGAEKHLAWSRWMKLEMDLRGTAAPSKSIVGHVSGPQLDALYLEIRQELIDLCDGDKQDALLLMKEFAKSRKKPVVVDAMPLQPVERSLTDGNFS